MIIRDIIIVTDFRLMVADIIEKDRGGCWMFAPWRVCAARGVLSVSACFRVLSVCI